MTNVLKVCCTCKISKPLTAFYKNRSNPSGLHYRCISCTPYVPKSKEQATADAKRYAIKHPEKIKASFKKWYYANREDVLTKKAERERAPERIAKAKEWKLKNRDKINELRRIRRKNMPPKEKIKKIIRDRFHKVIIRMKCGKHYESPMALIGCSIEDLKTHIESRFMEGMTWESHGNGQGKWNIDHIIPLVRFDLFDIEQQKKAFHYSNLRPLWFEDNMKRPRSRF